MNFLRMLESIRNPVCDAFFSAVTYLGDETVFLLLGLIFFWCVNKKLGRYLVCMGLIGTTVNQFLKLVFRIPRPWVLDESFTIVESARAGATGYSFPSGHTQIAVAVYGGLARWTQKRWVRITAIAAACLVPVSRLYLGVHTPLDVGVAAVTSLILVLTMYRPLAGEKADIRGARITFLIALMLAAGYAVYVSCWHFPPDIDQENLNEGIRCAWLLLGGTAGMWLSVELDERFIHFDPHATIWGQLVKIVLGAALVMGVRMGFKPLLNTLFHGAPFADAVRYFLIVLAAGGVWPMTFAKISHLGETKKQ